MYKVLFCLFAISSLFGATIQDKVLICGVCRNIEKAVPNTIQSATALGARFSDYRIIIYENNSTDNTKKLLRAWADKEPKLVFLSEQLSKRRLASQLAMKITTRTELIARARNIVLDHAMKKSFDGYKYIIWADLDFLKPWDVEAIVETILHPEQEWDAVLSYGAYDLFALRAPEWPIGFELVGSLYWHRLDDIRKGFVLSPDDGWKKVYSAFGGLGIYKRDACKGCRYSGVVTQDLETVTLQWLEKARQTQGVCFLKEYEELLAKTKPITLSGKPLKNRDRYPEEIGLKMQRGNLVWFSCTPESTLPWTCEHVPFHASMILKGRDKIFINPKIHSVP
jgi:glycosyltransferase involved in cell wall biosynthesis